LEIHTPAKQKVAGVLRDDHGVDRLRELEALEAVGVDRMLGSTIRLGDKAKIIRHLQNAAATSTAPAATAAAPAAAPMAPAATSTAPAAASTATAAAWMSPAAASTATAAASNDGDRLPIEELFRDVEKYGLTNILDSRSRVTKMAYVRGAAKFNSLVDAGELKTKRIDQGVSADVAILVYLRYIQERYQSKAIIPKTCITYMRDLLGYLTYFQLGSHQSQEAIANNQHSVPQRVAAAVKMNMSAWHKEHRARGDSAFVEFTQEDSTHMINHWHRCSQRGRADRGSVSTDKSPKIRQEAETSENPSRCA
jgi:hypothetical protein